MVGHLGAELLKAALCTALLLFPILVAWLPRYKSLSARARFALLTLVLTLATAAYVLHLKGTLEHRVAPWIGHVIGTESMFSSTGEMLGSRPVTLNLFWRTVLSLAVNVSTPVCLVDTWSSPHNVRITDTDSAVRTDQVATHILGPFTVCYWTLLLPRALYSFLYDRYLLGTFAPILVIFLLLYQSRVSRAVPRWSFLVLAASSAYAIAATHDWFALNRARIQAVASVQAAGIPLTRVQGGFDFDGWTQLEHAESVNWAAVQSAADHRALMRLDAQLPASCRLDFAVYTPAIQPEYFVVFQPMPCLRASQFEPITYSTWLPPHRRYVYIQRKVP
jgi:hypothetical protein